MAILKEDPTFSDAYYLLALVAMAYENYGKAIDVLDRAIYFDENKAEYHAEKARCFIALNRHSQARECVERAVGLPDHSAATLDTIGVVFTRLGEHAQAIPYFEYAVAAAPERADFLYNLAASQQFSGDFDGAQASYESAISLDPQLLKAHSALSQLSRQTKENNHISRLQKLWENVNDTDGQLNIGHALAKELEDIGEIAKSFEYLIKAKKRKRLEVGYSIENDRALFDAVKENWHELSSTTGYSTAEPIFIVGMPRTGTTLVERIISSHSEVFAAGELTNFALTAKRLTKTSSSYVLDPETIAATSSINLKELGSAYIDSTRPRTGHTPRFIDKMPLNFFYAGLISRALPDSRIIVLMRDPLDTCLSNYRQLFATRFPYYNYALNLEDTARYYLLFQELMDFWDEQLDMKVHRISYEALVLNPEDVVRKVLDYCDLEFEAGCLNFHKNAAPVSTASSVQVRSPIYKTSVARWRNYVNELEPAKQILQEAGLDLR